MRLILLTSLLALFLSTCDRAQKTQAELPILGNAETPVTYTDFAELSGLFEQTSDTAYIINFWATWCAPCREELPLLEKLAAEDHPKPLKIVLVSLDDKPAAIASISATLTDLAPSLSSVVLTDADDEVWGKEIDRVWTGSLPTTIIYRGQLRYVYRRAFNTYADLQRAVEPLMK
ncbi:TlpA disulfide reductase family protein [Lewinella sp. 4G2]|uniref:TlpA family protein disulfide reductase n=1 Tax=Lewinella sp. 4G2 TaxID=1803372 RepID=UPI0007B4A1E9|nr:TlpA disulfide reductase family protein [Lewinella sp. 4G2]OAV42595.1 hypothetical protein A3850_015220 [Lewinella sp. 4G2]